MENFKYNNESFIMPSFDPFRTSWFECSSCRNPLFEKQIMSKIPHICPHCGVHLENIICDEQVFHILYKTGEMFNDIDGWDASDIEADVWNYVSSKIKECKMDAIIVDAVISGSRCRGLENDTSDIDVVVEYIGDVREDALFNVLNDVENNGSYEFGGVKVDINPITADQTGTLAEYLPQVEKYLNEKKADLSIGESNSTPKRKGR